MKSAATTKMSKTAAEKIEKKKERAKLLIEELDEQRRQRMLMMSDDKRPVSLRTEGGFDKWKEQHLDYTTCAYTSKNKQRETKTKICRRRKAKVGAKSNNRPKRDPFASRGPCDCVYDSHCIGDCNNVRDNLNCTTANCKEMKQKNNQSQEISYRCSNSFDISSVGSVAKCIPITCDGNKNIGLKAVETIRCGEFLGRYTGKYKPDPCESCGYCVAVARKDNPSHPKGFVCALKTTTNLLRYVNNHCVPNCTMRIRLNMAKEPVVLYQAIKDIKAGEEVTVNYQGSQWIPLKEEYERTENNRVMKDHNKKRKLTELRKDIENLRDGKHGDGFECECGHPSCITRWRKEKGWVRM